VVLLREVAFALTPAGWKLPLHGNLKPANILLDGEGRWFLADYYLNPTTEALAYVAPEVIAGGVEALSPAADVYSLGAIFHELITGMAPSGSPPSSLRPGLSPKADAFCRKAMAQKPADRYPTMTELLAALDDYLATQERRWWRRSWFT
jgi:serine/threonine-protein kinase